MTPPEDQFELVYGELRRLAKRYVNSQHSLQPTSLVHEAYLKLCGGSGPLHTENRAHFMALAAMAMRQIIIDRARRRGAQKRGGQRERVTLSELASEMPLEALALDRALSALEERDPRQAKVAELRLFGGMTHEEIASHLDVSLSTVEKAWRGARAWLSLELG